MIVRFEVDVTSAEIKALAIDEKEFIIRGNDTFTNTCEQLEGLHLDQDNFPSIGKDSKATKDPFLEWKLHDILGSAAPWVSCVRLQC
mmetsp:Transcript_13118/g.16333  ORF Transcript_13118/g.16333 Transcript_13118/m.16333 type:complete len:87 (-) Transcript_13118:368-628(-)